jgi:prolyl-tRNA synthetase
MKFDQLPSDKLDWKNTEQSKLSNCVPNKHYSHQWFNTQLRLNNVCDLNSVEVPGAMIMLPWGQKICEQFATLVRQSAEIENYQEYAYPHLVPKNYFDPIADLMPIEDNLLNIHLNNKKLALSPTGECTIYHHWQSIIKNKRDLPKKIFQRTKYFRPMTSSKRSGGSVFLSMEAGDVFEFHACFSTANEAMNETEGLLTLFETYSKNMGVFALWTLRPIWTNRGNLYRWSFGGDAILPSCYTVQVASAYYQGDIFSKRFNITCAKNSFTYQSTGAITRRFVFSHLFQSIRQDGALNLHPNLAPIQVMVLLVSFQAEDERIIRQLIQEMEKFNIRVQLKKVMPKRQIHQEEKQWRRLGIPLKILFFGRKKHASIRIVMTRNDTGQEIENLSEENILKYINSALDDIKNNGIQTETYKKQIIHCRSKSEAKEALTAHHVISIPLSMNKASVSFIETFRKGEVLGFYSSQDSAPCIVTQQETSTHAYVSRRI